MKIIIDDKLPTYDDKLVFASSKEGDVFWCPLVEKAAAKLYGSYEKLSRFGNFSSALTHFTGAPVERVDIGSDDVKNIFRLVAEEIMDRKSIICMLTRVELSNPSLKSNTYYLVTSVKKPPFGSFRKMVKESNAMIKIFPTRCEEKE